MITILHVIESLSHFGGTARKLLYLTKYTDQKQYKHVFLCFKKPELASVFRHYGATVVSLNSLSPLVLVRKIVAEANTTGADVICSHFTRSLIVSYFAAKITRLPLIHNEHGPATLRTGPAKFSVRIGRLLEHFCVPRTRVIINNSKYTLNTIRELYSPEESKLRVVYNPVEKRPCSHIKKSEVHGETSLSEFVVGHIGGMTTWRDQATLIKAINLLKYKYPNIRLVMIGDGPARVNLEDLVKKYKLYEQITFVGYTNDIATYLKTMNVYVNPALEEGFGIAVVEAMLDGLPVILSNRGAHPELINEGFSGLLFEGGDPTALAEKLEWLLNHPDERIKIGSEAQVHAKEIFAPEKYARAYLDIVEEMLIK